MKKISTITALGILMFIAGHYWINDATTGESAFIILPVLLAVGFIISSIFVLSDNE